MPVHSVPPLVSLGFTALEAEIYAWLLEEAPVTGYRIAQAIGKPAPNVYKAIETLEAKGGVMVDEGRSRLCRPVPPEELLNHLERRFRVHRKDAEQHLARLHRSQTDDRVYTLRSADQVLERARTMLSCVREVAIVDAFPGMVETLRADLEAAAARGVAVGVIAYAPVDLAGVETVVSPRGESVRARWSGDWINVVIDGSEHLVALLGPAETVRQAVWSGSVYLSWVYHGALSSEFMLGAVERLLDSGASRAKLVARLAELQRFKALEAPGYRVLKREIEGNPR